MLFPPPLHLPVLLAFPIGRLQILVAASIPVVLDQNSTLSLHPFAPVPTSLPNKLPPIPRLNRWIRMTIRLRWIASVHQNKLLLRQRAYCHANHANHHLQLPTTIPIPIMLLSPSLLPLLPHLYLPLDLAQELIISPMQRMIKHQLEIHTRPNQSGPPVHTFLPTATNTMLVLRKKTRGKLEKFWKELHIPMILL